MCLRTTGTEKYIQYYWRLLFIRICNSYFGYIYTICTMIWVFLSFHVVLHVLSQNTYQQHCTHVYLKILPTTNEFTKAQVPVYDIDYSILFLFHNLRLKLQCGQGIQWHLERFIDGQHITPVLRFNTVTILHLARYFSVWVKWLEDHNAVKFDEECKLN